MKTREVIAHITGWLKAYVEQSNTRGFVVGVSGGIDSAVTSTLAAETGPAPPLRGDAHLPERKPGEPRQQAYRHADGPLPQREPPRGGTHRRVRPAPGRPSRNAGERRAGDVPGEHPRAPADDHPLLFRGALRTDRGGHRQQGGGFRHRLLHQIRRRRRGREPHRRPEQDRGVRAGQDPGG